MDSRIRYEVLPTEDTDEGAGEVGASACTVTEPVAPVHASPPAYSQPATLATSDETQAPSATTPVPTGEGGEEGAPQVPRPPPYDIAVDLPTYEQAEQTKQEEAARAEQRAREQQQQERQSNTLLNRMLNGGQQEGDSQLGTDAMFLCTFLMAFVFNWIGLLTALCVTQTVAGRLGAMAGFGLSLVKWVAIVKHSNWAADVATGDSLLWWLLILLGFLIFFRASTQYIRIKFHWQRLNQNTRNNIFYYF